MGQTQVTAAANMSLRHPTLLLALLLLLQLPSLGQANPLRVDQWDKKLTGAYWYVPTDGLPASLHTATVAPSVPIEQQTVYYLASCEQGVFNGWLVNQWSGAGVPPTLSCGNMTGTVSPKGDVAMILSQNGAWSTPWPVAKVMRKAGKLRTLVQASIPIDATNFVVHGPTWMTVITPKNVLALFYVASTSIASILSFMASSSLSSWLSLGARVAHSTQCCCHRSPNPTRCPHRSPIPNYCCCGCCC